MNPIDEDWLTNSLYGQHFLFHCEKTNEGTLGNRAVHAIKAAFQCIPFVISQIVKIFQMAITQFFENPQDQSSSITTDNRQIQAPMLRADLTEVYKLKLFDSELSDDALYLGANAEQIISSEDEIVSLPRTLYHLLFIFFALRSYNDSSIYPILTNAVLMHDKDSLESIPEKQQERIIESTKLFESEALKFLFEKNFSSTFTWGEAKELINDLCLQLEIIPNNPPYMYDDQTQNLWSHFYKFCFRNNPKKFADTMLKALALEWSSPSDTEILYRASHLSKDNIIREDNIQQSLSFSNSLVSGIVFEGTSSGTCTLSYFKQFGDRELYALGLPTSKLDKYFFYPAVFKKFGLLPLTARGEFSHPRLKIFQETSDGKIEGVQSKFKEARELTSFDPTEKIPTMVEYQEKVHKIYKKYLNILEVESC